MCLSEFLPRGVGITLLGLFGDSVTEEDPGPRPVWPGGPLEHVHHSLLGVPGEGGENLGLAGCCKLRTLFGLVQLLCLSFPYFPHQGTSLASHCPATERQAVEGLGQGLPVTDWPAC